MKRNTAFLIQKRDGQREWLRATKLARSIQRALAGDGPMQTGTMVVGDAIGLATAVLRDVVARRKSSLRDGTTSDGKPSDGSRQDGLPHDPQAIGRPVVTSTEIARAVERVLFASGHSRAAARFIAAGRLKRQAAVHTGAPPLGHVELRARGAWAPSDKSTTSLGSPSPHERN